MNTRINPTLNGLPHLGHAYLALVNQHAARSTGGKFVFVGEDDQTSWLRKFTVRQMREFGHQWLADLHWLGVDFDAVYYESYLAPQIDHIIHRRWPGLVDEGAPFPVPRVIGVYYDFYPYTRYLTAKVALIDHSLEIDMLIVGYDLLPRFSLYREMGELFGLRHVEQVFLPRLGGHDALSDVSKTNGAHQIRTYRERGWLPNDVLMLLQRSCLIDPVGGWGLDNILPQPRLVT